MRALALNLDKVFAADVIFFTTADDVLPSLAGAFARLAGDRSRGRIVLHTSATLDRVALAPFARYGAAVGSMHPMQAFGGSVMPNLKNVIFAVEGDPKAVRMAESIAKSLGGIPVPIATRDKTLYHAAGRDGRRQPLRDHRSGTAAAGTRRLHAPAGRTNAVSVDPANPR